LDAADAARAETATGSPIGGRWRRPVGRAALQEIRQFSLKDLILRQFGGFPAPHGVVYRLLSILL